MTRTGSVTSVDQRRLERAVKVAEREYPGAHHYRAGLYMDSVYVEVWDEKGAAFIVTIKED